MNQHYEAAHYPQFGTVFTAVEDKMPKILDSNMTVSQCRDYARSVGFSKESCRQEDGVTVFEFRRD